jgi:hypothetical protein
VAVVTLVHQGPGLTEQSYEKAVRKLTGKSRLESPADWPVEGLLVHTPERVRAVSALWTCGSQRTQLGVSVRRSFRSFVT